MRRAEVLEGVRMMIAGRFWPLGAAGVEPAGGGGTAGNRRAKVPALAQLGIEHIPASSPEARGRCERAFRTLQDRLPKELALAGITCVAEADRFLREVYLAAHNARFAVPAEQPGSAFVAVDPAVLPDILCIQEDRRVGNDNTVSYNRRHLQIPPSPIRPHYVRAKVRVHHYPDGAFAIFHGPRCLARYDADGGLEAQPRSNGVNRFDAVSGLWTCWTTPARCPQPHRPHNHHRSGQSMCYLSRTTRHAIYSRFRRTYHRV